jgi:hypothetical protein
MKLAIKRDAEAGDKSPLTFKSAKMRRYDATEKKVIPYDLLDEKLLQVVSIEKLSARAKYINSEKMFDAIENAFFEKGGIAIENAEIEIDGYNE